MKYYLENCFYDLVKDLLMSQDSWIESVSCAHDGVIVSLQKGHSQDELVRFLNQGPLSVFCAQSHISELSSK